MFLVIPCRKRDENQVNSQVVAENAKFEKFDAHSAQKYLFFNTYILYDLYISKE